MTYSGLHYDELRKQAQLESWQRSEEQNVPLGYGLANAVEGGIQRGVGWLQEQAEDDPDKWTDDALRLMGGGLKNISKIPGMGLIGKVGEAGGYVGGGIAEMMGVDRRIGGFVGSMAADAVVFGGAGKLAKLGAVKGARKIGQKAGAFYDLASGTGVGTGAHGAARYADPLKKFSQAAEEVGKHKSLKERGLSLYDAAEVKTIREQAIIRLQEAQDLPDIFRKRLLKEYFPDLELDGMSTVAINKRLAEIPGAKAQLKALNKEGKTLRRGMIDWIDSDPEYLHRIGAIDEIKNSNFEVLRNDNIAEWMKALDTRISGTKADHVALHHTILSSPKELLHPTNVSRAWREEFLKLARKKYEGIGSSSIVKQDVVGHKSFTSPKNQPNYWNVKGQLAEVLKEHTDLPLSSGGVKVAKEIGDKGNYSKGLEGQLQKVIRSLEDRSSHGNWARNETGWTLDKRLAGFPPEEAFKVAEHVFDMERTAALQGVRTGKIIARWKQQINNKVFGTPPDMNKALTSLQKRIDAEKIPDLAKMEKLYEHDLNALLGGGIKALEAAQLPKSAKDALRFERRSRRSRLKID